MLINYIMSFILGYLVSDIINQVKRNLREYPLQEAMKAQQIKAIRESKLYEEI